MLTLALKYLKLVKFIISVICDTKMNNEKLWRKFPPLKNDLSMGAPGWLSQLII